MRPWRLPDLPSWAGSVSTMPPSLRTRRLWTALYWPDTAPGWIYHALACVVAFLGMARGIDYLLGPRYSQPGSGRLSIVESFGDLHAWGTALLISHAVLLVAIASRHLLSLLAGHALSASTYVFYGIALSEGIAAAGGPYRLVTPVIGSVVIHAILVTLLVQQVRQLVFNRTVAQPPAARRSEVGTTT